MSWGILYGVGVGPGAADLMTLRAVKCLQSVDCIILPRRDEKSESVSWAIAADTIGKIDGQERLYLSFPMSRDPRVIKPAWEVALKEIKDRLFSGKSVAFITVGDPFIYSSFIYLYEYAREFWPRIEVRVIAGVSAVSAVPIAAGLPLADGQERVAIIPALYEKEDIGAILRMFDTVVFMKVASVMPKIVEALTKEGLLDRAVYVARATMQKEKIVWDLQSIKDKRCVYFSMVVVAKKHRSGILKGRFQEGSS